MKPSSFTTKRSYTGKFPLNVTNASNTLVAIANRNDTPCVMPLEISDSRTNPRNHLIALSRAVVARILGPEIAENFPDAMKNCATEDYFSLVSDRMYQVGIVLAYTREGWFLMKIPGFFSLSAVKKMSYEDQDLMRQMPNGFNGQDFFAPGGLLSSIYVDGITELLTLTPFQGDRVFSTVYDVVSYSVKMIKVRLAAGYESANEEIKARWNKDIDDILKTINGGYLPNDSPYSKDLLNTIRDTFNVQRHRETGDVHLTQEAALHIWQETLQRALTYLDNAAKK